MKRALAGERWRLGSISIAHFRGVAGERTVRFDGMSGLLHGYNGVGKSTVAQCLQWTLYGRFPQNVLANVSLPRFLAPVEGQKKAYSGEITFQRGKERLVIRRDEADRSFTLTHDARRYSDQEAEVRRDELLGLDMDTFVRAVVLQQSRIRGLLLDEPRERNKALDRLLGMDAMEQLAAIVQRPDFAEAARAFRQRIQDEERRLAATEAVLRKQREAAERGAREHKFLAKDFSPAGLQRACAAVGATVAAVATKYEAAIAPIPACDTVAKAGLLHRQVRKAVAAIRGQSRLTRQFEPVQARRARLIQLQKSWTDAIVQRDGARAQVLAWVEKNGTKDEVAAAKGRHHDNIAGSRKELGAANALYRLLHDAHAYVAHGDAGTCPVCEQGLPRGTKLAPALAKRMQALTSRTIDDLNGAIAEDERRLASLDEELESLATLESAQAKAQRVTDRVRRDAAKELDCGELADAKVAKRLSEAVAKVEKEQAAIQTRLDAMEVELQAVEEESERIHEGLVPVLKKREEQAAQEAEGEARKVAYAQDEARALRMDGVTVNLDRIRNALLRAQDELASARLDKARPRAAELYRKLVRHPRFDTLRIATVPRKLKVDYAFEVSVAGASRTALEARLALSDGQLTAAALGVFFALAESAAHGLDLLYVDDPTQNLDYRCKEAMAHVVAEIAKRKQVIVSTHDDDFVGLLESEGFHARAFIHRIAEWDGNPTYETTAPPSGASSKARAPAR
jgi:DNA repair exonuclease SbcCD ATPase subunit